MERRTLRRAPAAPILPAGKLTYRAEICRRDVSGHSWSYYDGGDFSPYSVESLVEMLRGETRTPYRSLDLTLEIRGKCTSGTVKDLARRFAVIHAPKVHVRICASGARPVVVTGGLAADTSEAAAEPAAGKSR